MSDAFEKILLLSPAWCGGKRTEYLLRPGAQNACALRLQQGTLTLGDAFTFVSGLYFRGKLAYASAMEARDSSSRRALVITPTRGLLPPAMPVSREMLEEFGSLDVDARDERYLAPLRADAHDLRTRLTPSARVVLLGSIATNKYVGVLSEVFEQRLACPRRFVGLGDMARGALLLRHAAAGEELEYMPLSVAAVRSRSRASAFTADAAARPARRAPRGQR